MNYCVYRMESGICDDVVEMYNESNRTEISSQLSEENQEMSHQQETHSEDTQQEIPVKRKRGRPPKLRTSASNSQTGTLKSVKQGI